MLGSAFNDCKTVVSDIGYFNKNLTSYVGLLVFQIAVMKCDLCNKTFKQKAHYDSHKELKTPCVKNTIDSVIVKPFLKWIGGKTQIIDEVLGRFPTTISGDYYEPFLGGGSVLLGLLSSGKITVSGKVYASDYNSNLVYLYKNIQTSASEFIKEVGKLRDEFVGITGTTVNRSPKTVDEALTSQESYYFWIRQRFNGLSKTDKKSVVASAMLLFMNKTGFRGMYREGPKGINVPYGNYKNPSILDSEHILGVSALIKDVVFTHASFEEALKGVKSGDFVYLDPPYAPETESSFVGYTADGFDLKKHELLFTLCRGFKQKGVKMLMSNADVKLVRDAFPEYKTDVLSCKRSINSKNPGSVTNEVLIVN
jgi:DNA adenine methylase